MSTDNQTPNTPGLIRTVRAELRAAAASMCSHGVPHATCAEHRPSRKQESSKPVEQEASA